MTYDMKRFGEKKRRAAAWPGIVLFLLLLCFLPLGARRLGEAERENRLRSLQETIRRMAVHCYAVEGIYPASLSYLEKHYGISWNPEEYAVDYEVFSSNLPPTVTVIDLRP